MEIDSQIVIGPDGTVLAATGQLPSGLMDVRLEDCAGLPREVCEAGQVLLHQSLAQPWEGKPTRVERIFEISSSTHFLEAPRRCV
jgi:hypothetical protein